MALMQWNEHFLTGIDLVDEQDRELLERINAVTYRLALPRDVQPDAGAEASGDDPDRLLAELEAKAAAHFRSEEALMAEAGIASRHFEHHRHEHAAFLARLRQQRRELAEAAEHTPRDFLDYLVHWVVYHILLEDRTMARQLVAIAAGAPPDIALERASRSPDPANAALVHALIQFHERHVAQQQALAAANQQVRAAQEAWRAEAERGALILASAGEGIYGIDNEGRLTFINPAAVRLLGGSAASMLGQPAHALMHHSRPDGRPYPAEECRLLASLRDGRSLSGDDECFWRADGSCFPAAYTATPAIDETGRIVGAVVVFQDISERLRAQRTLAELADNQRAVLEAMREGMVVHAADGRIILCNPAAERILGLTADQLRGRTSLDPRWRAIRPDGSDYPGEQHPAMLTLRDGQPRRDQLMGVHRPDGSLVWIEIDASRIALAGQDAPAVMATFDDVSERLAAEEALREREEIYHAIVSQAADAIVLFDADSLRPVEFNDAACAGLGYTREEFAALTVADFQVGMDEAALRTHRNDVLAAGGAQFEHRHRRKDGVERDVRVSLKRVDIRGRRYLSAIWSDITEANRLRADLIRYRDHLEEQVALRTRELEASNAELRDARDRAQQADRAKSSFLATVGHELLTPMNAIIGFALLLQQAALPDKARKQAGHIVHAAQHLLDQVNEILQYVRLESGEARLRREDFPLMSLVAELLAGQRGAAQDKGLVLEARLDPSLAGVFRGDPEHLRQVLAVLLRNALKFTDAGRISVFGRLLEEGQGQARVRLEVADTGMGIAQELQGRLFSAFQQLDDGLDRRHGGIGLGLAIAIRLARLMGGGMGVDSQEGEGSRFWLDVPLERVSRGEDPAREGAKGAADLPLSPQQLMRILSRLRDLLLEDDMQASSYFREVAGHLARHLEAEALAALRERIDAYDYPGALKCLEAALAAARLAC